MNCRQGDLAVIISAPWNVEHEIGRFVTCVRLGRSNDGKAAAWEIAEPFWTNTRCGHRVRIHGINDADLQPIRRGPSFEDVSIVKNDRAEAGKPEQVTA